MIGHESKVSEDQTSLEKSLKELMEVEKKQTYLARLTAIFTLAIAVVIAVCAIIVVPKVMSTLHKASDAVDKVSEAVTSAQDMVDKASSSLDNIDSMTETITTAGDNLNTMVEDNTESLTSAVKSMSEIDFEGLNTAIQDLQDAIGPFAKLMKGF
ncbi:hypothetical protein [Butyrivibrio sp. MC2013]|uniref:hypothetical protein n=1 Tax=Butyrivibrio sp. MC2013 TaxID=1280686 RepID=UPI0003F4B374|nr:hypothetical protein [Butyrivibrio sp. MC2013]